MGERRQINPVVGVLSAVLIAACQTGGGDGGTIPVGLNIELTGDVPKVGEHSRVAAEMFVEDFNAAGGIDLSGRARQLRLIIEDNGGTAEGATATATKLITQDNVLIMVGPNPSLAAVPAGEVANNLSTTMISPWSTNAKTTLDRPWVFRTPFLDPVQGPVLANFATDEFGADSACVLFDVASDAPVGQAEAFRGGFESRHGQGSVVAYESFTSGDRDFGAQLTNIAAAGCDVLFVPQYYNEVPLIVEQARAQGLTMPILGSDAWGDPQLLELCGSPCDGSFFGAHYVASAATGPTLEFIEAFEARHGETPSDVGALTWDSMLLTVEAIRRCGVLTGDVATDRTCIRDGMAGIAEFEGITGRMTFDEQGDPIKCVLIVRIVDGAFTYHDSVCP